MAVVSIELCQCEAGFSGGYDGDGTISHVHPERQSKQSRNIMLFQIYLSHFGLQNADQPSRPSPFFFGKCKISFEGSSYLFSGRVHVLTQAAGQLVGEFPTVVVELDEKIHQVWLQLQEFVTEEGCAYRAEEGSSAPLQQRESLRTVSFRDDTFAHNSIPGERCIYKILDPFP